MSNRPFAVEDVVLRPSAKVRDAMEAIDRGQRQIALVVDAESRLIATITDGDVRRGLIRGVALDAPVKDVMQTEFTALGDDQSRETALRLMREHSFHQIPIVDPNGCPVDLVVLDDEPGMARNNTRVVLMAGGLGKRLRPLTEEIPKPMLPVGGRPILELILDNFTRQGFHEFTIALNYKGTVIRDHFGSGENFNATIDYIDETRSMGTAGALSLLPSLPDEPFIVMNGDLLTSIPFDALVRFHNETGALATMCARDYRMQVPFGVVEVDDIRLRRMVEKPTYSYFVNAGIYVLSPEALNYVEPDTTLDMPTLFERLVAGDELASVFPIQEYWMDIGRPEDLLQARDEFSRLFQ